MESLAKLTLLCGGEEADHSSAAVRGLVDEKNQLVVDVTLEVDYGKNCTLLYKNIEAQDWETVVKFLDTGYWIGSLWADRKPPTEQAKTWVTRFDPDDPTKIKWSHLPLHLAVVVDAPLSIIRRLVNAYPKALKCTDDEHMLPFHLAMRHGTSDEVVDFLLAGFPNALNIKGKNNRTALECAMRSRKKARARLFSCFLNATKLPELGTEESQSVEKNHYLIDKLRPQSTAVEDELARKLNALLDTAAKLEARIEELTNENDSLKEVSTEIDGQMHHIQIGNEVVTDGTTATSGAEPEAPEEKIQEKHGRIATAEQQVETYTTSLDTDAIEEDFASFKISTLRNDLINLKDALADQLMSCSDSKRKSSLNLAIDSIKLEKIGTASMETLLTMKKEAELHQHKANDSKKGFLGKLFTLNQKQSTSTSHQMIMDDMLPTKPPRALTADEESHASSEPESECDDNLPLKTRTMSYGNLTGADLKSASIAENSPVLAATPADKVALRADVRSDEIAAEQ